PATALPGRPRLRSGITARPVIALRVRMVGAAAVSARLAAVAALRPTPAAELRRGPAVVAVAEAIGANGFFHSSTVSSLRPSPFSAGDWAVFWLAAEPATMAQDDSVSAVAD